MLKGKEVYASRCLRLRIGLSVIENIAETSGTTIRARRVIDILKDRYQIVVITRGDSIENEEIASLNHEIKIIKPARTKLWNLKLIPLIIRCRFDLVYCVADIFGFITYYLLSKFFRYKVIFEAHALAHKEMEQTSKVTSIFYHLLEVYIGGKANAIIALSGITYRFYRRLNKNTFFIPVFIDAKLFNNLGKKSKNATEKVVGLIGPFNILPNKCQLDFLYTNLNKFDKRIRFKIIGKYDKKLNNSRIEYTGYLESTEEYVRALCQLDALLVPVKIATFGPKNKILEAMACSLPVFTTPKGIVGLDFTKHKRDLFVLEEYELVDKLNSSIFNNELMKKIGTNARMTVERYYSKTANERKLTQILEKIANSRN